MVSQVRNCFLDNGNVLVYYEPYCHLTSSIGMLLAANDVQVMPYSEDLYSVEKTWKVVIHRFGKNKK